MATKFDKKLTDDNPFIKPSDCAVCEMLKPVIMLLVFVAIAAFVLHGI